MRTVILALIALSGVTATLPAQQATGYRSAPDTLWFEMVNPYHMYWVRGADTLGTPIQRVVIERQQWLDAPDGDLHAVVVQQDLDVSRAVTQDTFTVSPRGEVLAIRGPGNRPDGRRDFVLHLPDPPVVLAPGVAWSDTVRQEWTNTLGPEYYTVERRLRVARMVDTLGTRVAEVVGEGTVRYRMVMVLDSAAGTHLWQEVEGPVSETFHFDVDRGRMIGRTWDMDLRGRGAVPREDGGMDTIPAGLRSGEQFRLLDPAQAALHTRALPRGDTTITVEAKGAVLLHTVRQSTDRIEAALARNDGMVGTVAAELRDGRLARLSALWTDIESEPRTIEIRVEGDAIEVEGTGRVSVPADVADWAVADFGMEEMLLPMLARLPRDETPRTVAIYRPYPGKWSLVDATVHRRMGVLLLVVLAPKDGGSPQYILFEPGGSPLFVEKEGQSQRLPRPGTPEREGVEQILQLLTAAAQGGGDTNR